MRITPRCQCRGVPCGPACSAEHCAGRRPHCEEGFVKVGQTFLPAPMPTMSPRKCVYCVSALRTIEQTGDSSPALRMTCFAISIGETCRPGLGTNCHPEEALSAVPGTGRRQADEGSPAEVIHTCAAWTCTDGKGGTSARVFTWRHPSGCIPAEGPLPLPPLLRGEGESNES